MSNYLHQSTIWKPKNQQETTFETLNMYNNLYFVTAFLGEEAELAQMSPFWGYLQLKKRLSIINQPRRGLLNFWSSYYNRWVGPYSNTILNIVCFLHLKHPHPQKDISVAVFDNCQLLKSFTTRITVDLSLTPRDATSIFQKGESSFKKFFFHFKSNIRLANSSAGTSFCSSSLKAGLNCLMAADASEYSFASRPSLMKASPLGLKSLKKRISANVYRNYYNHFGN